MSIKVKLNKGFSIVEVIIVISIAMAVVFTTVVTYGHIIEGNEIGTEVKSVARYFECAKRVATPSASFDNILATAINVGPLRSCLNLSWQGANYTTSFGTPTFSIGTTAATGDLIQVTYPSASRRACSEMAVSFASFAYRVRVNGNIAGVVVNGGVSSFQPRVDQIVALCNDADNSIEVSQYKGDFPDPDYDTFSAAAAANRQAIINNNNTSYTNRNNEQAAIP